MATPITAGSSAGQQSPGEQGNSVQSDFRALLAWLVFIGIMWGLTRIPVGRVIVYYGLVMLILFILLTQYQWIASALEPLSNLRPGLVRASPANQADTPTPSQQ